MVSGLAGVLEWRGVRSILAPRVPRSLSRPSKSPFPALTIATLQALLSLVRPFPHIPDDPCRDSTEVASLIWGPFQRSQADPALPS